MKSSRKIMDAYMVFLVFVILTAVIMSWDNHVASANTPKAQLSIYDTAAFESDENAVFLVILRGQLSKDADFTYCTKDGLAKDGEDYEGACNEKIFLKASSDYYQLREIKIPLINDDISESVAGFELNIIDPSSGIKIKREKGEAIIVDDDHSDNVPLIGFAKTTAIVSKDAGKVELEVALSKTLNEDATVEVQLKDDDGLENVVSLSPSPITFLANSKTAIVTLEITDDDSIQEDKTFSVVLYNALPNIKISEEKERVEVTILHHDVEAGSLIVYLPYIAVKDKWIAVAENQQRPVTDQFDQFYGVAQCRNLAKGQEIAFAGANNGLYLLDPQGKNWDRQVSIPYMIVNNVAFANKEKCNSVYAAVYASNESGTNAGVWEGVLNDEQQWKWFPDYELDPEAASSTWSLIIYEDLLLVGTAKGLHWKSLSGNEQHWNSSEKLTGFVTSFALDNQDKLLATVWKGGIYQASSVTDVKEDKWEKIPGGPEDTRIYQSDRNNLGLAAGTQSLIYYQNPAGDWRPSDAENELTYAVLATERKMYAGRRSDQIQYSSDGGVTWNPMLDLPSKEKGDAEFFKVRGFTIGTDGKLYAGTSSGVWKWSTNP